MLEMYGGDQGKPHCPQRSQLMEVTGTCAVSKGISERSSFVSD